MQTTFSVGYITHSSDHIEEMCTYIGHLLNQWAHNVSPSTNVPTSTSTYRLASATPTLKLGTKTFEDVTTNQRNEWPKSKFWQLGCSARGCQQNPSYVIVFEGQTFRIEPDPSGLQFECWKFASSWASPTMALFSTALETPSRAPKENAETAAELVARIRAHLSLNTTDLAKVLGVERPTIYGWIKAEHSPQHDHRNRLRRLGALAAFWTEHCKEPLGDLKNAFVEQDRTVLDLLRESEANYSKVQSVFTELASRANEEWAPQKGRDSAVAPRVQAQSIRQVSTFFRK